MGELLLPNKGVSKSEDVWGDDDDSDEGGGRTNESPTHTSYNFSYFFYGSLKRSKIDS